MQRSLAARSLESAQRFDAILSSPENVTSSPIQHTALDDQYARFKIWAGDLGAFDHLPSDTSIDYRLRDSQRIAEHVRSLLSDLSATLRDGQTQLSATKHVLT